MNLWLQRIINARVVPAGFGIHQKKLNAEVWPPDAKVHRLNFEQHIRNTQHNKYKADQIGFQGRIKDAIASGQDLELIIDNNFPSSIVDFSSIKNRITRIDINTGTKQKINFKGIDILAVYIAGAAPHHNLTFDECHIGELSIKDDQAVHLELKDTWISNLNIKKGSVRHLEMQGGGILSLVVQAGDSNNPFTGPVTVRNVYLPRETGTNMNPQRLRDIRGHLLKMNNMLAAGEFHSAELALDRAIERFPNNFFSWLYEIMADFGNSPSRPLKSLLFFLVLMSGLCFFGDAIREPDAPEALGWKESLVGSSAEAKLLRSVTYSISSILNPLGIIQSKPLLVSKSAYWTASLAIAGLGGTLSIVFLVIAIRRRFKLE